MNNRTIFAIALLAVVMMMGPASAGTYNISITNETYSGMEYGDGVNLTAIANGTDKIVLMLNTTNTSGGAITWNINVTNTTQDVTIHNGTTSEAVTNHSITMSAGAGNNVTINLTSTACIPFFTIDVTNAANASETVGSTNLSFVPAASAGVVILNKTSYVSGDAANATVTDLDANLNSSAAETLIVNVTSTTNSTNTSITLTETGANTSIFNGTFDFSAVGAANTIRVSDGDTIYANYTDNGSVLRPTSATFDAEASKLVINSTTYGNLTTQSGVETIPTSMVAGVATVFKINATDANGVLDTGFTGTMTISVNGSATATPASYPFVTADNGTKNVSITDNVAETIKIDFNSTSFTNDTITKTVVPNKPAKLVFNSSMPRSTLTNSLRVNISVTDAYDNLINASKLTGVANTIDTNATQLGGSDGLGLTVAFNVLLGLPTAGSSSLDNVTILINNSTVNTNQAWLNDTTDETVILQASSAFFTPVQTSISFMAPVSYLLLGTNKTAPADTASANGGANSLGKINITAQLMSTEGVALAVPGTTITFNSDNLTVMSILAVSAVTNADGIATITNSTTNTAGTAVITAMDASGHVGKDASGNIGLTVTTTPVVKAADSTLSVAATARAGDNVTVYATIVDYGGARVPAGTTVSFNITTGDSASTLNGVAKSTIVTADTNSTGVATVPFRATNGTMPGVAHTINATIVDEAGVTQGVGAAEQPITVTPNNASVLVVSPASKGLANILGETVTFTVTAYDNYENKNTSIGSLKVNVSTTNTALGNMTVGSTTTNNYAVITTTNGVGTMDYKVNTTTPGDATLTFAAYTNESSQVAGLVDNITKTVLVTTSGASGVTITPSVPAAAVDTNITLTVNLTDAAGNLIGIDGTDMNLVISAGTASLNNSTLTSSGGQAFANLTSATAGGVTVTVYVAGLTSASTTVTFSGNATSLVITPESASVNLGETTNLTIQAYDALGNKAATYNGAVISTQTGVIPAVTGLTFNVTSFTFDATGCAVVNVTNATSATAGTYTVQAVALGMIGTTDIEFTEVGLLDMTVTATPPTINVSEATDITINVTDATDAAISGAIVTLEFNGTATSPNSTNTTVADGTCTITVNVSEAGPISVNVTAAGYNAGSDTVTVGAAGLSKDGNIDGIGGIDMDDVVYLAKHYYGTTLFPEYGTIYADGDIDCDGDIDMDDVVYLAKHYYGTTLFPDHGTLYPC